MNHLKSLTVAGTACLALLLTTPAIADEAADAVYGTVMGAWTYPDAERDSQFGLGLDLGIGIPLSSRLNLELNGFTYGTERESDEEHDFHHGLGINLMYETMDSWLRPILIGGIGATVEDVQGEPETYGYFNLGLGGIADLPADNLSLRLDIRYFGVVDGQTTRPEVQDGGELLSDVRYNFGLQFAFASSERAPKPAPVAVQSSDSDADGVEDARDRCPGTAPGTVVDPNGCPLDSDGDGVADAYDRCPNTEAGLAVGPNGCALNNDEDNDGIANDADQCPGTPQGFRVDASGCVVEQTVVLRTVGFELNSDRLTFNARRVLLDVANALKQQAGLDVAVEGHTDSLGSDDYNQKLSQRRANAVIAYLVQQGIDATRLKAVGHGESRPVASNETADGREQNRRVEFKIVDR